MYNLPMVILSVSGSRPEDQETNPVPVPLVPIPSVPHPPVEAEVSSEAVLSDLGLVAVAENGKCTSHVLN